MMEIEKEHPAKQQQLSEITQSIETDHDYEQSEDDANTWSSSDDESVLNPYLYLPDQTATNSPQTNLFNLITKQFHQSKKPAILSSMEPAIHELEKSVSQNIHKDYKPSKRSKQDKNGCKSIIRDKTEENKQPSIEASMDGRTDTKTDSSATPNVNEDTESSNTNDVVKKTMETEEKSISIGTSKPSLKQQETTHQEASRTTMTKHKTQGLEQTTVPDSETVRTAPEQPVKGQFFELQEINNTDSLEKNVVEQPEKYTTDKQQINKAGSNKDLNGSTMPEIKTMKNSSKKKSHALVLKKKTAPRKKNVLATASVMGTNEGQNHHEENMNGDLERESMSDNVLQKHKKETVEVTKPGEAQQTDIPVQKENPPTVDPLEAASALLQQEVATSTNAKKKNRNKKNKKKLNEKGSVQKASYSTPEQQSANSNHHLPEQKNGNKAKKMLSTKEQKQKINLLENEKTDIKQKQKKRKLDKENKLSKGTDALKKRKRHEDGTEVEEKSVARNISLNIENDKAKQNSIERSSSSSIAINSSNITKPTIEYIDKEKSGLSTKGENIKNEKKRKRMKEDTVTIITSNKEQPLQQMKKDDELSHNLVKNNVHTNSPVSITGDQLASKEEEINNRVESKLSSKRYPRRQTVEKVKEKLSFLAKEDAMAAAYFKRMQRDGDKKKKRND
ncbi:MAG: hypothetical protein EXX96DRAFT_229215 [Benjaminiella poitrasii]|nr:MAG: hypothetical protein EXX96DRAFT_229215 [Benjaminiella poitrasii]